VRCDVLLTPLYLTIKDYLVYRITHYELLSGGLSAYPLMVVSYQKSTASHLVPRSHLGFKVFRFVVGFENVQS
jgi:hypothetical protein